MNRLLFEEAELSQDLPLSDPRLVHVRQVLRMGAGEEFDAGIINGPYGKASWEATENGQARIRFRPTDAPPPLPPIALICGQLRPVHMQRLVRDAATLGLSGIWFVPPQKGEAAYAQSDLYSPDNLRRLLIEGAAQAFDTLLPHIGISPSLEEAIAALSPDCQRLALDNYEHTASLATVPLNPSLPIALAVGAERGWNRAERRQLIEHGFTLVQMGGRVLRTETAVVAALSLVLARTGRWG